MNYDFSELLNHIDETASWLKKEYTQISTGRANPALLDSISVDSYGSMQPIKNIASITIEDVRTMRIIPWDKNQIGDIQKAILASGLPISASADSEGVRASIPQLTQENRTSLVKIVKDKLEQARITIRGHRQETQKAIEQSKKDGELTEDETKSVKEDLEKHVKKANEELEAIFAKKETDIMSVS